MKLSLLVPVTDPDLEVNEFLLRLAAAAWILVEDDYEILAFGSVQNLPHAADVPNLARFETAEGQILAPLQQARGERIFFIKPDANEDPEWLLPFWAALAEDRADIIFGQWELPRQNWFRKIVNKIFKNTEKTAPPGAILFNHKALSAIISSGKPDIIQRRPLEINGLRQTPFVLPMCG